MSWTDERVEALRSMWTEGKSASQIAKELGGVTRNAVIGKVHRRPLEPRRKRRPGGGFRRAGRARGGGAGGRAGRRGGPRGRGGGGRGGGTAPGGARAAAGQPPARAGAAHAAAALGLGDQRRGAGQSGRGREEVAQAHADAADRAHLQMAGGRSRDRGILVLRPARLAGQALLRGACGGGLPANVGAARPARRRALTGAAGRLSLPVRETEAAAACAAAGSPCRTVSG
ncbi:MAG: hypothetical protein KDJ78_06855 [Rhodobacteraceae bacterium]|nr:hypothetical protein [Paracoccaceae bacterium]